MLGYQKQDWIENKPLVEVKTWTYTIKDMKRILTYIILMCCICCANAQTQQGIVKTRGRLSSTGLLIPGFRLQGVTICIKNGGAFVTGNNGNFSFAIPSNYFSITDVKKKNYQLCDRDVINRKYTYSSSPLILVMDTPSNTMSDRLNAERNIRKHIEQVLHEKEKLIEDLRKRQIISEREYQDTLQFLYLDQASNEKFISEMVLRYSKIDFDENNEFYNKLAYYIQNGELNRADSLLNTRGSIEEKALELDHLKNAIEKEGNELSERVEKLKKSRELLKELQHNFSEDCYKKYEICRLSHERDSALYWLNLRLSKDSTNIVFQCDLAFAYYEIGEEYREMAKKGHLWMILYCYNKYIHYIKKALTLFEEIINTGQKNVFDQRIEVMPNMILEIKLIIDSYDRMQKELEKAVENSNPRFGIG